MFVYVFEPFHPPHVNRGDWHSGSNPDASDCSSDVKVMKTGGSPYQQPTSYLGGDRATAIFILKFLSCKECKAQEREDKERIEGFLHFRLSPDDPSPLPTPCQPMSRPEGTHSRFCFLLALSLALLASSWIKVIHGLEI